MNIIGRSLTFIKNNIGKSAIIAIVMLISFSFIYAALTINETATRIKNEHYKDKNPSYYVSPDYETSGMMMAVEEFTKEDSEKISEYEHIEKFMIDRVAEFFDASYKLPEQFINKDLLGWGMTGNYGMLTSLSSIDSEQSFFSFIKYNFTQAELDKMQGVILNDELLEALNLNVGDEVTYNLGMDLSEGEQVTVKIAGTYSVNPTPAELETLKKDHDTFNEEMVKQGYISEEEVEEFNDFLPEEKTQVYIPINYFEEFVIDNEYSTNNLAITVELTDIKYEEDFKKFIKDVTGKDASLHLDTWEIPNDYEMIFELTIVTSQYAKYMSVLLVVVLTLIVILFVHSRRKEIGILRALGLSKKNVYFQLALELMIIALAMTIISVPIGQVVANKAMSSSQEIVYGQDYGYVKYEAEENQEVVGLPFETTAAIKLVGITFFFTLISTAIPAIYILRLKPKEILL